MDAKMNTLLAVNSTILNKKEIVFLCLDIFCIFVENIFNIEGRRNNSAHHRVV